MRNIQLKLLFVIPLCLLALSSSYAQTTTSQQKPKSKTKVETTYNEQKNETTARIGPFVVWEPPDNTISGEMNYERVDLSVSFSYPGKIIVRPRIVTIVLSSTSHGGPQFVRNRGLSATTESGRYDFDEAEIIGSSSGRAPRYALPGSASILLGQEALRKTVPFDDFASIARSKKVTIKLGDRKFKLTKQHLEAFRNFVLLMEQEGLKF